MPEEPIAQDAKQDPIRQLFEELKAEKARLEAPVNDARARRDAVVAKMQPLEAEAKKIFEEEIKPHLEPLGELDRQIAALARALGAKVLRHTDVAPLGHDPTRGGDSA